MKVCVVLPALADKSAVSGGSGFNEEDMLVDDAQSESLLPC